MSPSKTQLPEYHGSKGDSYSATVAFSCCRHIESGIPVDHGARAGGPARLDEAALRRPVAVLVLRDTASVGEASVASVGEAGVASVGEASVAHCPGGEASVTSGASVVAGLHAEGPTHIVIVVIVRGDDSSTVAEGVLRMLMCAIYDSVNQIKFCQRYRVGHLGDLVYALFVQLARQGSS